MQLAQLLDFESLRVGVSARTKRGLLNLLAIHAAQRLGLDPDKVQACVATRERLGTTGFGNGVAIPHGKLAGLKSVYVVVVRLAEPIDYKAIDDQPVDIVFLLLSPLDAGAEHLKALAAVSRATRNVATLERMRGARSRDAFAAVVMGADERDAA
ncbi:MAG: PTS sugar transporter subunit IIA [Sphingomicrobium sp.]